jgi:hypothetical protein
MNLSTELIPQFPHKAPKDYSYEFEKCKNNMVSIWLRCHRKFDYNNGAETRTIWGFYRPKTREYFAPINSKTIGACVRIEDTRPWTSMKINYQGVEQFFV